MKNFGAEKYYWKVGIVQKIFARIAVFCFDFICWAVSITPDQNVSNHLVNNMYNINIRIFWHRRLFMKTSYSSKRLLILLIFLGAYLRTKCHWTKVTYYWHNVAKYFLIFVLCLVLNNNSWGNESPSKIVIFILNVTPVWSSAADFSLFNCEPHSLHLLFCIEGCKLNKYKGSAVLL